MKYRKFGKTGMKVSAIGLGTSTFGGVFGDVDPEECYNILETSLKKGINYIDTAPWYGQGKAEKVLGEVKDLHDRIFH